MNVVITGASSGIGRELVRIFARKGHAVLAVARRKERLEALRQEMEENYQATIYSFALDIISPDACQILYEEAVRVFSRVHVLINNAGMSPYQEFRELNYKHIHQSLSVNVQSLTELCHIFMRHMLDHGETSHVINVGSVGGYVPLPNFSIYAGTKHYVRIFTNQLYHEYRKSNIRVSALHPGGTLTEFPELAGERVKKSAQKMMMTPEKVAEIAYPAILSGKRIIIPGIVNKVIILIGKLLPFTWSIKITKLIYNRSVEKIDPTYPL